MSDLILPRHFNPRTYQYPFLHEVEKAINKESDVRYFMQVWHRRSGKDKVNIADVVPRRLVKDPCSVKYVFPTLVMGRENLWDGIGADGFRYMNHIPTDIRIGKPNESRMEMRIMNNQYEKKLENHSLFRVAGSDNPDSLRGGNSKLDIFSEWSEQDPYAWDVVEPILRENDGVAIFNMTPKGDNHARALYEYAKNNPQWYVQVLTALDTGVFTVDQLKRIKEDIIMRFEANGRSAEEATAYYEQEYMCSFTSPVVGAYYGAAMRRAERENRITSVPHEKTLPVNTDWDLGMDDSMTIWFWQQVGQEIHFIDYYENSGEGIEHYIKVVKEKDYVYGIHTAPHDIAVREIGTGKSRLETAKKLGLKFAAAPRLGIDEGINAVRSLFNRFYFDRIKCNRGIMAIKNYRKDWDEKNKVFRLTAKHDWSSHGCDALRTMAVGHKGIRKQQAPQGYGGIKPLIPGVG